MLRAARWQRPLPRQLGSCRGGPAERTSCRLEGALRFSEELLHNAEVASLHHDEPRTHGRRRGEDATSPRSDGRVDCGDWTAQCFLDQFGFRSRYPHCDPLIDSRRTSHRGCRLPDVDKVQGRT